MMKKSFITLTLGTTVIKIHLSLMLTQNKLERSALDCIFSLDYYLVPWK